MTMTMIYSLRVGIPNHHSTFVTAICIRLHASFPFHLILAAALNILYHLHSLKNLLQHFGSETHSQYIMIPFLLGCVAAASLNSFVRADGVATPSDAFSDLTVSGISIVASATAFTTSPPGASGLSNKLMLKQEVAKSSDGVFFTTLECKTITGEVWCAIAPATQTGTGTATNTNTATATGTATGTGSLNALSVLSEALTGFKTSTKTGATGTGATGTITGGSTDKPTAACSSGDTACTNKATAACSAGGSSCTDTATGTGQATGTGAWSASDCNNAIATNAAMSPSDRWKGADTDDAWKASIDSWTKKPSSNSHAYSQQMANFLHGPDQMYCEKLSARDGCASNVACSITGHPANSFILDSMVAISDVNYNIYDAIGKANGPIVDMMGTFSSTFAPIDDPQKGLKVFLDIIGLGFALTVAPIWNIGMLESLLSSQHPQTTDMILLQH